MKRNYVYLFALILGAWVTKIFLHAPAPVRSWSTFYDAIAAGHGMPAWLVVGSFTATFVGVIGTTLYIGRTSSGEFTEFGMRNRALWKI